MSILFFKRVAFVALPIFALGCTESTTSEDVSEARQDVREEQQDVDELRHEAMKPEIDDDLAEDIQEEQQDVTEAQADLRETEQDFAATQARDSFINEAQASVDAANRRLEELETVKDGQDGAAAEATQRHIDDLEASRDRLEDAISDMKGADLQQWNTHKSAVETAHQELVDQLNAAVTEEDPFEATQPAGAPQS